MAHLTSGLIFELILNLFDRSEYISDIRIVYTNQETLPPGRGWELINKTVSGSNKATLNRGSESAFLAVRRVKFDPIDGPYPLVSLCVVLPKKGEVVPKDYRTIERNLSKVSKYTNIYLRQLWCKVPYFISDRIISYSFFVYFTVHRIIFQLHASRFIPIKVISKTDN